jgi:hypothetical protein
LLLPVHLEPVIIDPDLGLSIRGSRLHNLQAHEANLDAGSIGREIRVVRRGGYRPEIVLCEPTQ